MRKARLMLMLFAVLLIGAALPPATQAGWDCEILCWDYGTQYCWQDSACRYYCCDVGDPGCSTPCW